MDGEHDISNFCDTLREIWSENVSDLSFGMLISIVVSKAKARGRDINFMENYEVLELFKEFKNWG